MSWKSLAGAVLGLLLTLLVVNIIAGFLRHEQLDNIPEVLIGTWKGSGTGYETTHTLYVDSQNIRLTRGENSVICNAEKILAYYDGSAFLGNIFGERRISVVCDKVSTKNHNNIFDRPDKYRKEYFFTMPKEYKSSKRYLVLRETKYKANQYARGGGVHVQYIDHFTK